MRTKRAKKNQRRQRRREADKHKNRRRCERLTAPLRQEEGRQAIVWLDTFLSNYRNEPDPEEFDTALTFIEKLNLLLLEEHKYTMTAVVATIYRMHPEFQARWKKKFLKSINRAERLYPEQTELKIKIERPHQIDQALIDWMVSGDTDQLGAIAELADRPTELGELAEKALSFYAETFPEVSQYLKEEKREPFRRDAKQHKQAEELATKVQQSSEWHKVVLIHYQDGHFTVVTMDGNRIEGLPITWEGCRIECRKATPLEITCRQAWRNRMEDPV